MAFMLTRGKVKDYDAWKTMFDSDPPKARERATGYRVFRSTDDPNEIVVAVEFATNEDAQDGRQRLLASGVLDRLPEHTGPNILELADSKGY